MLILSRVCADFHDRSGAVIHRVTPENRLTFHEAPEGIREDPLFRMLVDEGSLEAAVTAVQKRKLEAEPLRGTDATGKKVRVRENGPSAEGTPERKGTRKAPATLPGAESGIDERTKKGYDNGTDKERALI